MGKRVLIVDDAAFMRMMLKDILTKNGYEVCGEAATGKEAIEKYKECNPDLTTLDITMPEMDGITALGLISAVVPFSSRIMLAMSVRKSCRLLFFAIITPLY